MDAMNQPEIAISVILDNMVINEVRIPSSNHAVYG
jgi:hypothetical protein